MVILLVCHRDLLSIHGSTGGSALLIHRVNVTATHLKYNINTQQQHITEIPWLVILKVKSKHYSITQLL